ncbi:alpha/beta hydrolase [Ramlibacter sp.]|uniref:alpha/beta fold hydrolase n=1 Tax=Ramlibacter sp. TaxID=1917967 RepID=UPI002D1A9F08|nr:alpha/beta hydrolase [Ramlibacter sp.]HWI83506.1 alpha/beta hydrolase [Ramlibacter sp.]
MNGLWLRSLWLVLAGIFFFAAIAVVAAWAPDVPVDDLKMRWAAPPSRFVEVNGQQIHVRDEGPHDDPAPIILLHGTSDSLHTWQGWAEGLREHRRVIRFDLPGFGLTGPNRQNDYSMERYVMVVRAVADKLGVDRFVLAGNSLGGQIAWITAAQLPERVDRLILVDASGYPPELFGVPQELPLGFRLARTPGLRGLVKYVLPRGVVERTLRQLYGDPAKVTPQLVDRHVELARREGNRQALARRLEQSATPRLSLLKEIKAPTLVLWGGKDRLLPPEMGQRFERDIPHARLVVFGDLGHLPQEEDPQRTLAEVRQFLGL